MNRYILNIIFFTFCICDDKYKEPNYRVLKKYENFEIREYDSYVVAKTSLHINKFEENNMFRTLASYIFGENETNTSIATTAPVTTFTDDDIHTMMFYMLDVSSVEELPAHCGQNIYFDIFNLGKCAVISFSWFTTEARIKSYTDKLERYIEDNNLTAISPYMVNRYDPPWRLPFMRRNEIIVRIN